MNCKGCKWLVRNVERRIKKMTATERKLLYLLQDKAELDREIEVGKEAEEKVKVINEKIRGCCIILGISLQA